MRKIGLIVMALITAALWVVIGAFVAISLGCERVETAEGVRYIVDVNAPAVQTAEQVADVAVKTLPFLSALWPWATLVAGIVGGVLGAWRKMKPKLVEQQKEKDLYYNTARMIVLAIENFKKANPDAWNDLADEIENLVGDKITSVIRALRGLPPKV